MNWFEVKIKYEKLGEDGRNKKVSESYMFDALSFTEAEARAIEEMKPFIEGEFSVSAMKLSTVHDLFAYDSGAYWYKAKVQMLSLDEKSGKEKRCGINCMVMADNIQEALDRVNSQFKETDCIVSSVSLSSVLDVFKYEQNEQPEI